MEDGHQNLGRRRLPRSSLVPASFESEVCAAQRWNSPGGRQLKSHPSLADDKPADSAPVQ
jgi:hypothetical protein